ncbi:MAG: amidohydrolase family protein [Actinomycetota bacterium]|nr:amidohydrolase family protein [Actinomycetota bacterium]
MTTTLLHNGTIRTNIEGSTAGWVLVDDGLISEVAPPDHVADLPEADRVVDLDGGALVPGFCDAHVHLPATGLYAGGMDFRGVHSADHILESFANHAAGGGAVMFGGNFEDPLDRALNRRDLDRVVGERPAMLARADMHSCIVSSALIDQLDLTGIDGVDVDEAGEPTGYLREQAACGAWNWFDASLPRDEQIAAIRAAIRHAYSKGVTSVHEMFVVEWRGWPSYDVFTDAIDGVALNVVTYLGTDEIDKVKSFGHDRIGGDYFLDGSFGSHTAWMKEPFVSPPPEGSPQSGIKYRDDDELYDFFLAAQRERLQVGVHAIGDAAIEQAITTWERVAGSVGDESVVRLSHRIEHFECAGDDHISRAKRLGLRASVQPAFDAFWGGESGLYTDRIGVERAREMNRFGSMCEHGLSLAAGSDSTVTPLDPFLQMRALRAHHVEGESISGELALALHTIGGHTAARQDDERGAIETGAIADLAWLDLDPVTTAADDLQSTEVLGTWASGRRVWPPQEAEAE